MIAKEHQAMANRCAGHCEVEMDNFDRNAHLGNDDYMLGTEDPNYIFNPDEIQKIGDTTDYSMSPDSPSFDPAKYVQYRQENYIQDKNKSPEQILADAY